MVRFLAYLEGLGFKYSTINNYVSSVVVLHKFYGVESTFRESYLIQTALAGLRKHLGSSNTPRLPLSLEQLCTIYSNYPRNILNDCCWLAVLISFCTLLRKSNLVFDEVSGHTLLRKDVSFLSDKVVFTRLKHVERVTIPWLYL